MKAGVVVIGRNEASQLGACLEACAGDGISCVYVDSASTDGSVEIARGHGVPVVQLGDEPGAITLTAAAGRNAGFRWLMAQHEPPDVVQFVDGDCILAPTWLAAAEAALAADDRLAIVTGRLRERLPAASVFQRLCDMEWNAECGRVDECGGIFMIRAADFAAAGGFREQVAAGEEPELCLRLRQRGREILRLPDEMAAHDAAMHRFGQWWRRQIRGGWAYAHGAALHGRGGDRFRLRQVVSNWVWGLILPVAAIGLAWPTRGWSLLLLLLYAGLILRVTRGRMQRGDPPRHAWLYGVFTAIGKFPNAWGQCCYLARAVARK